ncbi:MAG: TonB-dependent receptor [Bacteroidales bacterium]|nr:TonB-dependent receptor [Bacteroidales bacterium]MBN2820819.1 TonB-dependent receptor [Bacteroidales bacterium]
MLRKKASSILLLLLLLAINPGMLLSQIITVVDSETNKPLELATLYSDKPIASTLTNIKGQADISIFRNADRIEIRILGYKPYFLSYANAEILNYIIPLEKAGLSLDEVVVSTNRWNQLKKESPVMISIITPKDVKLFNPQTAADLLEISGDVYIQKSQLGGGSPMIRGFSTNRVLIAVDGIRMNNAIFRSGNLQNVISLDPFSIEKTEIIFGPGSVIYGSDAIGGVMSFQTLNPQLSYNNKTEVSGKTGFRYSTVNNEKTGHLSLNFGWKKWALVSGVSFSDFDDLKMGSNGPDEYLRTFYVKSEDTADVVKSNGDGLVQKPTGYSQVNIMQKVYFKPNKSWDYTYGFHYSVTSDYSRYDRLIRTKNDLPRSAEWNYGPQLWMMNNFMANNHNSTKQYDQMAVRLAHQLFKESRIDRDFNDAEKRTRIETVNAISLNIDLIKNINNRNKILYGFETVFNLVDSYGRNEDILNKTSEKGPSRYPQANWFSNAIYLNWQNKLSEKLILQGGARYNYFNLNAEFDTSFYPLPFTTANLNKGALTGSLGITWNLNETWVMNAALSTGFRSPNVDDIGKIFDSEPGSVIVPNPELEAEYAYNAEAGISKTCFEILKLDISGFYTILNNALVRRDYTFNGLDSIIYNGEISQVQAIQNAAKANVYGFSTGIDIRIINGLDILSKFNFQKGTEELDDGSESPLRHAAPWFGRTHVTYSVKKLQLDLYAVYNGKVSFKDMPESEITKTYMYAEDENGNPYSPAWYTVNLKAVYQIKDRISISTGIENITDQRYRPYSSGIVAPGRNFIVSLNMIL